MTVDIRVPALGESVTEATVGRWLRAVGDAVVVDDPLVELETDKVTLEVPAPATGRLAEIAAASGANVSIDSVLGTIAGAAAVAAVVPANAEPPPDTGAAGEMPLEPAAARGLSPAVRRLVAEHGLDEGAIPATGRGGRLVKADVLAYLDRAEDAEEHSAAPIREAPAAGPREERVRMTRLRQRIAERLMEAQSSAAMLTTFNEVDMSAVTDLRAKYGDAYKERHRARLGFMPFFVKAAIVALREVPVVNAEIDGDTIVYKNHYDIGIAVGTPRGLVVPVLRDADRMSFADLDKAVADAARRARDGTLGIDEMRGGTFTVTNGGAYGSLLSTPILNPPQSGILGMHKVEDRPVAEHGEVVVRPMMYVALTYDHRLVDGREAVSFLVRVKQCVEDPQRILLDA